MRSVLHIMLICLAGAAASQDAHEAPRQLSLDDAPVKAEVALDCVFAQECVEAEACAESGFAPALTGMAGGLDRTAMVARVLMSSEAGDVELLGVRDGDAMSLSGGDFEARHLLTLGPDGAARYTVHYADVPMMVSYLGVCK